MAFNSRQWLESGFENGFFADQITLMKKAMERKPQDIDPAVNIMDISDDIKREAYLMTLGSYTLHLSVQGELDDETTRFSKVLDLFDVRSAQGYMIIDIWNAISILLIQKPYQPEKLSTADDVNDIGI